MSQIFDKDYFYLCIPMNIFKRILGHIYFFYVILLFLITMLLVVLPIVIINSWHRGNESARVRATYKAFVVWMNVFLTLIFIRVKRKGLHYFERGKNYVVVVNHNSLADIPISSPYVPGPNKTLAKMEFMKIPIFNIIYKSGSILVDRSSEESRKQSIHQMMDTLAKGIHLTLYPEGTRNKTEQPLQTFYDGAFRTAILAQKDIIPGILFGTKKILPTSPKYWAWPHQVRFEFLPAISVQGLDVRDTKRLKEETHELMRKYILENQ